MKKISSHTVLFVVMLCGLIPLRAQAPGQTDSRRIYSRSLANNFSGPPMQGPGARQRLARGRRKPGGTGGRGSVNTMNSDGLLMSAPQPVLTGQSIGGMSEMPDQQTPIFQANGWYKLYVTGVDYVLQQALVSVFTTPDLANPSRYQAVGPVLTPPYKKGSGSCDPTSGDACAAYVGMEAVFQVGTRGKLVGFYIADQTTFATSQPCTTGFWGQLMVGTSTDGGNSWSSGQPTLRATPVPTTCPHVAIAGFNQPTVIKIGNEYYLYSGTPTLKGQGTAVARATVGANGLPGPWAILSNGKWTIVPTVDGVQTIGNNADIVVSGSGGMPWVSFNKYLQTYLMTLITQDGFYYSKLEKSNPQGKPTQADLDAQKWTTPQLFQSVPGGQNWKTCAVTWENLSFVTPGFADNHTTGKNGFVVLSIMPGWGCPKNGPRSLAIASYAFGVSTPPPPPVVPGPSPAPSPKPSPCRGKQPCQK